MERKSKGRAVSVGSATELLLLFLLLSPILLHALEFNPINQWLFNKIVNLIENVIKRQQIASFK